MTGASLAAAAQIEPGPVRSADPTAEILVTGTRGNTGEAVHAFVENLVAETGNGRVARWSNRICLTVEGGSAEISAYFADRIGGVAESLGIQVLGGRRCESSALIILTDSPDRLLARLAEERPRFFGDISPVDREGLRNSAAPVRWVTFSDLRGANGEIPMSFYIDYRKGGMERPVPATRVTAPSRLASGARMDLSSMLVLVDASDLDGISNRSLSAYLAMVVLGNLRPDHENVGQLSILDIFRARSTGELINADLSDWDLAYLHSLYQGNWDVSSDQRVQRIQASMARNLDNADFGED